MWQVFRGNSGRFVRVAAAAVAAAFIAGASFTSALAQQKPDPAAEAAKKQQQAAEAGKKTYESGVKSYQAGKFEPAVAQISEALKLGGLTTTDMARALYIRGLAYKKQNRPGLAISDLTSALWLKNGLSEQDRQSAMAERADAYKQAGLGDGASVADVQRDPAASRTAQAPVTVVEPEPTSPALTLVDPAAPARTVTRQDATSQAAREAAEARRLAAAPVEDNSAVQTLTAATSSAAPTPQPVEPTSLGALPTDAPSTAAAPSLAVPDGVSNFFSNLFGGSTTQQAEPVALAPDAAPSSPSPLPTTTASTSPLVENSGAATSGWQQTAVIPAQPQPALKAKPQTAPPKQAAAPKGKYKLHIAAVRSRAEAEMLAQRLAQSNGADLANRAPTVDEAVIGSMGTFYRVRVGGYQNPEEPRGVCNKIRTSGFDCLVVTN
jgi:tetratricopeptide (TPR) repeat protein